jgi:hypothetical protein
VKIDGLQRLEKRWPETPIAFICAPTLSKKNLSIFDSNFTGSARLQFQVAVKNAVSDQAALL